MGWGDGEFLRFFTIYQLSKVVLRLPYALLQYLRAAVTHGERGEHKPRNGDRIHTSVPYTEWDGEFLRFFTIYLFV